VKLVIGSLEGEHLALEPVDPEWKTHVDPGRDQDYWWIRCAVDASANGFRGSVQGSLLVEELRQLRDGLIRLRGEPTSSAGLDALEAWLFIHLRGDRLGHVRASCEVRDDTQGTRLTFELNLDQTYLLPMIHELDDMLDGIPMARP